MAKALRISLNVPAVQVLEAYGPWLPNPGCPEPVADEEGNRDIIDFEIIAEL